MEKERLQRELEDIVTFELEKTGVLNRFQSLFICQRSVASMRYVLEGRVGTRQCE